MRPQIVVLTLEDVGSDALDCVEEYISNLERERDRYKQAWEDELEYSSYTGTKKRAAEVLDLSKPLVRVTPMKK